MASRENQGLQIAVMIFFLLVVLLAVTTYVFFKSSADNDKIIGELRKEVNNWQTSARTANDEITRLKVMMGFTAEDELGTVDQEGTIEALYKQDMDNFSVGYEGDQPAYRKLLEYLHNSRNTKDQELQAALKREEELTQRLASVESTKEQQIDVYEQSVEKITAEIKEERDKFNADRARVTKTADEVAAQLDAKRNEIDDLVAKNEQELKRIAVRLEKVTQINNNLRERAKTTTEGFDVPDGRITWVNQRTNTVWLNIGQADNLKRQTVFSVYPADQNQAALSEKKGSIEVTRIIDRHMAEARILSDELSNPILPGDKISSPVWNRGRRDGFALVGFMDIDKDGKSDRQKVRELISLNGGDIVCELQDDGQVTGKLELSTRYLVLGESPTGKEKNENLIANFSQLTGQAQELGIEKISLAKFISQMGYHPDERTVPLGRGAKASDFKAKPPEGVQRRSTEGTSEQFQKRARPRTTF